MVLAETLKHHFQTLGVEVEDEAFLGKCLDLCDLYNVSGEVLVEMWVAFMVEKASALEPTLETLGQLERAVLKKDNKNIPETRMFRELSLTPSGRSPRIVEQYADNEDILEMYGYKGPSTPNVKRVRSPDGFVDPVVQQSKKRALDTTFSPARDANKTGTPRRIHDDETSGKLLEKFGRGIANWKTSGEWKVRVCKTSDPHIPANASYMFELLPQRASKFQRVCREYGARLCSTWCKLTGKDAPSINTNVNVKTQTTFRTFGRILAGIDGKLTASGVRLEGFKSYPNVSPIVALDLTNISRYSLFPGQIVAIEGKNPNGLSLIVQNIFTSGYTKPSPAPKIEENLHLIVASGPFVTTDELDYQSLFQLMDHVADIEPHVLILIGPFVPSFHPDIQRATILDTFQEFFEQIVEKIMNCVKGKSTQVVLIPSPHDAHHDPVYPTPEFFLPKSMHSPNLHLMPDPCMLDIEGLTVGVTSADIMRHLSDQEVNLKMPQMDHLGRLANHVLSQGCFYPLCPPSTEINIDTNLWEKYAFMYQQPHILLLPSDMKHFCKFTHDCFVINPERLNKGSYARMVIRPSFNGSWTQNQIDCEILKI